jgi:hypothetical protein
MIYNILTSYSKISLNTSVPFKVKQLVLKKSVVNLSVGNPYLIRVFLMSGVWIERLVSHKISFGGRKVGSFL